MSVDFWKGKRVLVTGATGLVGAHLAKGLAARGADVVALVRDWVPSSELLASGLPAGVTCVRGDLADAPLVERAVAEYEVGVVFHLGAQTIVGVASRSPVGTFEANVRGTWNVLEAARRTGGVAAVVVASSDKAYGTSSVLPYDEETPLRGEAPYDASKACAELVARSYHRTYGLPVAVTRCGNIFGGGDLNWSRLIPGTIRSALAGERPTIRSDGTYRRDYFYVEDAVAAYLRLAEEAAAGRALGEAFNFSYERPLTVLDATRAVLAAAGREDLEPVVLGTARGEIRDQFLSARKAREILGWRPTFSFDEGLRRTFAWYRERFPGGSPRREGMGHC